MYGGVLGYYVELKFLTILGDAGVVSLGRGDGHITQKRKEIKVTSDPGVIEALVIERKGAG